MSHVSRGMPAAFFKECVGGNISQSTWWFGQYWRTHYCEGDDPKINLSCPISLSSQDGSGNTTLKNTDGCFIQYNSMLEI